MTQVSFEMIIISSMYLEQIRSKCPDMIIDSMNLHKLVYIGLVTAAKFYEDEPKTNEFYARVGGIPLDEMNALELEYLKLLDFHLLIEWRTYEQYSLDLVLQSSRFPSLASTNSIVSHREYSPIKTF